MRLIAVALLVLGALAATSVLPPFADAINVQSGPTTAVTPDTSGDAADYTWSLYRATGNESVRGFSVTFPAGTDVSGATSPQPGAVTVSGQTVTVMFDTRIPRNTNFSLELSGIINPPPGTLSTGDLTLHVADRNGDGPSSTTVTTADYTIVPGTPELTLTIVTPDAGQDVDFGMVEPGAAIPAETVSVTVDSNMPYTITRVLGGQFAELGLTVTGLTPGLQAAGLTTYDELYTIAPPWTTDPGAYSATVLYTVVHQ